MQESHWSPNASEAAVSSALRMRAHSPGREAARERAAPKKSVPW